MKKHTKRLVKTESAIEERLVHQQDANQNIMSLHARIADVESVSSVHALSLRGPESPASPPPQHSDVDRVTIAAIQARLHDVCQKNDFMQQESHDVHARVEAQEERLKSMRTSHETKEQHYKWLADRVERADWDGKFKDMQTQLNDIHQQKMTHSEKLSVASQRLDVHEVAHGELQSHVNTLRHDLAGLSVGHGDAVGNGCGGDAGGAIADDLRALAYRVGDVEARLETVEVASPDDITPRVAALVQQLKDVAPKVIDQDACVRNITERLARLEGDARIGVKQGDHGGGGASGTGHERLVARVCKVEAEVARLHSAVEGVPPQTAGASAGTTHEELAARLSHVEADVKRLTSEVEGHEEW